MKSCLLKIGFNWVFRRNSVLNLFILVTITSFSSFASDKPKTTQYQRELDRLYESINKVQQHLKTTRYQRSNVLVELKTLEQEISQNSIALKTLSRTIKDLTSKNRNLRANISQLNPQRMKGWLVKKELLLILRLILLMFLRIVS